MITKLTVSHRPMDEFVKSPKKRRICKKCIGTISNRHVLMHSSFFKSSAQTTTAELSLSWKIGDQHGPYSLMLQKKRL